MEAGVLGRTYRDGEIIVRQGDIGECMYVIQEGQVEVFRSEDCRCVPLATLGKEDFFGEMSIFERERRSASVRAIGEVRILTIEKKTFLRSIHEDPSLAFRLVERLCHRIRELDGEIVRTHAAVAHGGKQI